jgi:hypothetical protein
MSVIDSRISLKGLKQRFATATLPTEAQRGGFWKARFIGPLWLRLGGMPSCYLGGLWGWLGKKFLTADSATNVLARGGGHHRRAGRCSARVTALPALDGRPVAALTYGASGPGALALGHRRIARPRRPHPAGHDPPRPAAAARFGLPLPAGARTVMSAVSITTC